MNVDKTILILRRALDTDEQDLRGVIRAALVLLDEVPPDAEDFDTEFPTRREQLEAEYIGGDLDRRVGW